MDGADYRLLLGWKSEMGWAEFLQSANDQLLGLDPSEYRVRGVQLAATVYGEAVGSVFVRFELNTLFEREGGHIGYLVLPTHRRTDATDTRQGFCVKRWSSRATKASIAY